MSGNSALVRTVEQLRREARVERINVSDAANDLLQYVKQNASEDFLLNGFSVVSNPFKEKKSCTIV
ncbi:guanine nucleotide-binding protein G(I)/G(S)/G(O) subunit gamma-10-like [Antedon mediterranea]|uniref:guanine nucleotide-binding protein G(I)/G(S)/G(O) subunit gamma-10-like n=1 Tax=Antedon mediterranea TaxID=105859 RepID=UPI003AF7A850